MKASAHLRLPRSISADFIRQTTKNLSFIPRQTEYSISLKMASKLTLIALFLVMAVVVASAFDFEDFEKRQNDKELDDAIDLFSQHVAEKRGRRFSVCQHPFGYTCWCDKKFKGQEKYYRVCDFASDNPINGQ